MFPKFFSTVALTVGLAVAGCGSPEAANPQAEKSVELRVATPQAEQLPAEARAAMVEALQSRTEGALTLISVRFEGTWALGTLTAVDLSKPLAEGQESHLSMDNLYSVLVVQTEQGWQAALEGDERLASLLARVPESELSSTARAAMFPRGGQAQQQLSAMAYAGYKFFWPANVPFVVTQGWHDTYTWGGQFGTYMSLDFDVTNAANSDILAGAPGTVTYVCNDGTQVLLVITTSGTTEKLGYLHLSSSTVAAAGIGQGSVVNMGTKLGQMVNSDGGSVITSCGSSYGTHLHVYFPYKPITIDGKTFSDSNYQPGVTLYSSQGSSSTTEVIVDNTSAGFTKFGPSAYWYTGNVGYGGSTTYTYANGTTKSNYAQWKPSLPSAGYYTVYAFIPNNYATSQQAPYRIYHNGANNTVSLNQNAYYDAWVSLGQYYFAANGSEYVELSDNTGEAASLYRMLGFDAVKFVK